MVELFVQKIAERTRVATVLAIWIWTFSMSAVAADKDNAVNNRTNVVFILADDLGWGELGCYGQKKIPTPHIRSRNKP